MVAYSCRVDHLSREGRSRNMAAIRSKDTKPELALRQALWYAGVRGWRCHRKSLPGKPDLSWGRWGVAVECRGAYWHGHPDFIRPDASDYWREKIARNRERDRDNTAALRSMGWTVVELWDFEVIADPAAAAGRVIEALRSCGYPDARTPDGAGAP
jgi:DNA mismatch endonuclease (patch repair protein)